MTQVILNLVSNAIKFTQKGFISLSFDWKPNSDTAEGDPLEIDDKNINFITSVDSKFQEVIGTHKNSYHADWFRNPNFQESGKLIISVKDSGCGISQQNQKLIFDKFRQVESGTDHIKLGLGLGLWISKVITNLHQGEILVDSEEGKGSCFSVVIPTTAKPLDRNFVSSRIELKSVEELEISTSISNKNKGLKALVVEDFPINQIINTEMLKKYGVGEVLTASNGQEAIKIIQDKGAGYFDVITMDLEMPIMNGKEAIQWIRRWEEKEQIVPSKIVIISGNAVEKEIQTCTDQSGPYRADTFLTKPCDYNKLEKTLVNLGIRGAAGRTETNKSIQSLGKKILFADDEYTFWPLITCNVLIKLKQTSSRQVTYMMMKRAIYRI